MAQALALTYADFERAAKLLAAVAPEWTWRSAKSKLMPHSGYLTRERVRVPHRSAAAPPHTAAAPSFPATAAAAAPSVASAATAAATAAAEQTAAAALALTALEAELECPDLEAVDPAAAVAVTAAASTTALPDIALACGAAVAAVQTLADADSPWDCYEHHIAYSATYRVPQLLFSATRGTGGGGAALELDDVLRNVPDAVAHAPKHALDASFITQTEHPALDVPFYAIHCCNTAAFMRQLLAHAHAHSHSQPQPQLATAAAAATPLGSALASASASAASPAALSQPSTALADRKAAADAPDPALQYLVSWLSVVGPRVGCHLSLATLTAAAAATAGTARSGAVAGTGASGSAASTAPP